MDTKFLVKAPEIIDYIPGETQLPNSREYMEKTLSDISEELTEKLHEEGVVSGMEFAKLVKDRLYGEEEMPMNRNRTTIKVASVDVPHVIEHFHEVPDLNLDPDICYDKYKDMVIDPFMEQRITLSTAGFGGPTMLDKLIEQLAMKAGQKMFLSYIYGIDPVEVCRDYIRQTWEIFISPLWSETLYRVRPIDIQKGGWKCRRRTRSDSIHARGAGTKQSIQ